MDALLEAIGKLFLVFKDPVNVVLLLVCFAEGSIIWKIGKFVMDRYDKDIDSRAKLASALEGLTDAVKEAK